MKASVLNINAEKVRDIELPVCFSSPIRGDLVLKVYELSKRKQPYSPFYLAGNQASASGKVKHARRKWKTVYGYGMSRVPRKIFARSGNRFTWQGATVASTRGGRQAHPPKIAGMLIEKKINKKEKLKALFSAIAATASYDAVCSKYIRMQAKDLKLPLVIDSLSEVKAKQLALFFNKIFPGYSSEKKPLIVLSKKEDIKTRIFDSIKTDKLSILELCPSGKPGRIVLYTENALNDLKEMK